MTGGEAFEDKRSSRITVVALFMAAGLAAWLRLHQLHAQVLIEDEWHPVHQLVYYPLRHILTSFGNADYSIPLVVLYYFASKWLPLSELGLRLPMVLAGIATVAILPWMVRRHVEPRAVALFAILLAVSPFLIYYSRIARPYALTLLAVYIAAWMFEGATVDGRVRWGFAATYGVLSAVAVWLHPVIGPVIVAPLVAAWWGVLRSRWIALRSLLGITAMTGSFMAVAVVPPLLGDPAALSGKSGIDSITLSTVVGASYLYAGTGSTLAVVAAGAFAAIGLPAVLRLWPVARWVGLGVLMLAAVLLVTRPWWVDRPLAFARYVLPALPIALLSVAVGMVTVWNAASRGLPAAMRAWLFPAAIAVALIGWLTTSPVPETLRRPNSYTQHSYFQLDYRKEANGTRLRMASLLASPFWGSLDARPAGSVTVAVAPFRYATYEWPGPVWEATSRQRVIPAYTWGACISSRHGEIPPADARFRFRNAVHLADPDGWAAHGVDYIAYYRGPVTETFEPTPDCEKWMRGRFGQPVHEDAELVVWALPQRLAR